MDILSAPTQRGLFRTITKNAERLAAAGVTLPAEFSELIDRVKAYQGLGKPCQDRLVAAVMEGADVDVALLRAAAISEHQRHDHTTDEAVLGAASARLRGIYADHAVGVYDQLRAAFNTAAKEFVKAAALVDVDLPADEVVGLDNKSREAWTAAPALAQKLTDLLEPLTLAARLAGAEDPAKGAAAAAQRHGWGQDSLQLGLVVAFDGHTRRLWEAWSMTGTRTEQWAALVTLGASIEAKALDTYSPQRRPSPIMERVMPDGTRQAYDPEDTAEPAYVDGSGAWKPKAAPGPVTFTTCETR